MKSNYLTIMSSYVAISKAISKLFAPFVEVVIHDIECNHIVFIEGGFSKRQVGDPSYLDDGTDWKNLGLDQVVYEKTNVDGRSIKSVSIPLVGDDGTVKELMCINFDVSFFSSMKPFLDAILDTSGHSPKPEALFKNDLDDRIHTFIHAYLARHSLSLVHLTKEHKRDIILELRSKGAFDHKHAAAVIGRTLDLSRASIYNYLKKMD
ncbi:MAG: PAS domain-containing protein [Alphaproteobacteria bacterium]|nr:PAS domain-containing protein [Alphaproteobacteria bacterium]